MATPGNPTEARTASRERGEAPSITAVVPMLDEAAHVATFLPALRDRLASLTGRFEIVVVNDGSRDATRDEVLRVAEPCGVNYVELSRNFGKEAALSAGLEAARGEVVVLLDADGQHPLESIPEMLARWREGYDMVYGVRAHRREESLGKRIGAAFFYGVLAKGTHVEIPPGAGDFRLLDRKVVEALKRLPERTRFMKGLYGWVGFKSTPVTFEARPRAAGRSAFGFRRLAALALDGMTSFTTLPLRAVSAIGLAVSAAALAYGAWVVFEELYFGIDVPGYPTIVASIMFFAGVQLVSIGIIGEYLGRVFEEVKRRPNFIVEDAVDFSPLPRQRPGEGR
jgi:polyisoprenyl-phosphate glycosyltransferase